MTTPAESYEKEKDEIEWSSRLFEDHNHNRLGHLTNQSRADQSQDTRLSDQLKKRRPNTTDWAI